MIKNNIEAIRDAVLLFNISETCCADKNFDYGINLDSLHFYLDLYENMNWIARCEFEGNGIIFFYPVINNNIQEDNEVIYDIYSDYLDPIYSRGLNFAKEIKKKCGLNIKHFCNLKD